MLLKEEGENEGKGKEVATGKGKEVVVGKGKGVDVDSERRVVVFALLAVQPVLGSSRGKRKLTLASLPKKEEIKWSATPLPLVKHNKAC